ncbi:MAG: DUF2290 domain-containing protein [Candidatus Neomarinimicrobiota bacterium]
MIKKFYNQIDRITTLFIENGVSVDQNYPVRNGNKIYWDGFSDISYILKSEKKYETIYSEIRKKKDFNILFLDGAIFQFMYEFDFKGNDIIKQRLAYFPNINTQILENVEEYSKNHYDSVELFSDINVKKDLVCPVHFDFDNDKSKYKESKHTYSHCTIANYKNCRIPVSSPITPYRFIQFILKNFYNELYEKDYKRKFECSIPMKNFLTPMEKREMHLFFDC